MADVTIYEEELFSLHKAIREEYIKRGGSEEINWNSNIPNYEDLSLSIKDKLGINLSKRFLKSFFYEAEKEKQNTLRKKNLDVLYNYCFAMNRDEYQDFSSNKNLTIVADPKIMKEEYLDIDDIRYYEIINLLKQGYKISLRINNSWIYNPKGNELLKEILDNNYVEVFTKYAFKSLSFEIVDDMKSGGNDPEKTKYFLKRIKRAEKYFKLTRNKQSILALNHPENHKEKADKIKFLEHSYLETNTDEHYLFLCVIAFDQFFDELSDESRMLRHFSLFNRYLKEKNPDNLIIRFFTLPCVIRNGEYVSSFDTELANQLLYQYLVINAVSKCETFLLLYDVNKKYYTSNNILLNEDYVIRLQNSMKLSNSDEVYFNYSRDFIFKTKGDGKTSENRLYIPLPEDESGRHQIISDQNVNNIVQFYEDFQDRMRAFQDVINNDGIMSLKVNGTEGVNKITLDIEKEHDDKISLKQLLNINDSNKKSFKAAGERARKFFEKIKLMHS